MLFVLGWLDAYGQLQGSFSYGQDGHIYFTLSNPTGYQIPVVWGVYNFDKQQQRQNQGVMNPYDTFVYGPNMNWVWEKGERFAVTYTNGKTNYWTCPETDPAVRNSRNPSFRGAHCRGTVGCDCSGFAPITNGNLWQREDCRKCSHKKMYHK